MAFPSPWVMSGELCFVLFFMTVIAGNVYHDFDDIREERECGESPWRAQVAAATSSVILVASVLYVCYEARHGDLYRAALALVFLSALSGLLTLVARGEPSHLRTRHERGAPLHPR